MARPSPGKSARIVPNEASVKNPVFLPACSKIRGNSGIERTAQAWMSNLTDYLHHIETALAAGNATEHTHRPALKALLESLETGIVATNEPRRIQCGAPDFILTRGQTPLGYLEAKDVGKPLDTIETDAQLKRYRE